MRIHNSPREMTRNIFNRIRLAGKKTYCYVQVVKESRKGQKNELRKFHGVMALKKGKKSNLTNSEVAKSFRKNTGVNIWTRPFKDRKSKALENFSRVFIKRVFKKAGSDIKESDKKRVLNLAQALIRNPILRGDYGRGDFFGKGTKVRGIWTGQLFDSIKAKLNGN